MSMTKHLVDEMTEHPPCEMCNKPTAGPEEPYCNGCLEKHLELEDEGRCEDSGMLRSHCGCGWCRIVLGEDDD